MKTLYLFPVFLAILGLQSCAQVDSTKVAPTEIYTSYSATYNEDSNRVNINATFTVGKGFGTQVSLSGSSAISVNGSAMREQSDLFGGVYYEYSRLVMNNSDLLNPFLLRYIDNDGRTYLNAVRIPSRVMFASPSYLGGDLEVSWNTFDNLGSDEYISGALQSNNKTVYASDHFGGNRGRLIFKASELATISGNAATLMVCRNSNTNAVDSPSAGGYLNTSYCAGTIRVSLR